jgi:hypothetical protein
MRRNGDTQPGGDREFALPPTGYERLRAATSGTNSYERTMVGSWRARS